MKLDCPHGQLEKHKAAHSTGYSNAIVCPNNALIGGDNCGDGEEERGSRSFSNQPATEIKGPGRGGREAQVSDGEGRGPQRGGRSAGVCAGPSQLKIKTRRKELFWKKKKKYTDYAASSTSGSLTRFRG